MPKVNWGVSAGVIDDFDRDVQYRPYAGPIPPLSVYHWTVKTCKYAAGDRQKLPQLRVGLELTPRDGYAEEQYEGYFIMLFIPVSDRTAFRYVPFLDAIGASETDFRGRTICDEDGNIRKIGRWTNDGRTVVAAELRAGTDQDGNSRREIGWVGAIDVNESESSDAEYYDDDNDDSDDDTVPATPPRRAAARSAQTRRRTRSQHDDDDF